jgi:hypothetical protein
MVRFAIPGLIFLLSLAAFGQGATPQQIDILPIPNQIYGVAPLQVVALASSDLPVTLSAHGPATLNGRFLTITGTGTVIISAQQKGNATYAPASAQASFSVLPGTPSIQAQPATIVYGTPFDGSVFAPTATVVPAADPAADVPTVSWQLNTSQINGGSPAGVTVPYSSSLLRYESDRMVETSTRTGNALAPDPAILADRIYKVAFTCDCQQFEFAVQSGGYLYRLWVDGSWATTDSISFENDYPSAVFFKVAFPDKRPRQIKVELTYAPAFYGLVVGSEDKISPPQVPLRDRVIIFGDSWTGPTIVEPVAGPYQPGLLGSGYAQTLGEYFNWDWWEDGEGGTGFVNPGPVGNTWPQRALTDLCGQNPDRVVVFGGGNDGNHSEAEIQQAATLFLTEVTTCLPGTPIYLIGPQSVEDNTAAAMAAAAALFPDAVTYAGPAVETWIYGIPDDPTTGNAYLYIDGHPTPLGQDFLAEKVAETLMGISPALTQPTFPLFAPSAAAGSFSYSHPDGERIDAGQWQVSVIFTPADAVNFATAAQPVSLTVRRASSTLSLVTSASSVQPGGAVNLTAKVTPQIAGVPTGVVLFTDGGQPLGSAKLNGAGVAALTASNLAPGAHSISASYAGDANFLSALPPLPVTVSVIQPNFSFAINPTQITLNRGQAASVQLTATSTGELAAKLNVSCTGLPQNSTCAMQSNSEISVANDSATHATLTIQAESPKTTAAANDSNQLGTPLYCLLASGLPFCRKRKWKGATRWVTLAWALLMAGTLSMGCGSHMAYSYPAPGNYQVQIELVDPANPKLAHSQTLEVTIQ